ncbi:MFS transporter [Xenorhabdus sp. 12]|uniref:MFS transporter n=1 Tax=Xenorhabdus santafensis TaxID=2582833 RepID=A0ABU4S9M3_9GAMM|nr:MFS transporter [Xenorhabdus sp. 12]MDX7987459.1 MFS transporter [Xenorhabdus sp. 12]
MPSYSTSVAAESVNRSGLSIVILAVAAFVIVTTEYLIVGLLPALSRDLNVSISAAGQLVTLFALTVMLFGPVLTALLSHLDRKRLFIVILLIFSVSNALAAVAPNIWILAIARFIPALMLPVFWGTASETAGQIVGPKHAGRAVSQVYLGISAALLFGIPLGTLASDYAGWRSTFWGLAGLSLLMAILMFIFMPTIARPAKIKIKEQTRILKDPRFVANVMLSVVIFTAMFTAYTYLANTLEHIAGIQTAHVGWWLMGFGAIGLIGNWLGGQFVDNNPLRATVIFTLLLGIGMSFSVPLADSSLLLGISLAVWGIAYTALFPICQVRVMKSTSHAQALAGTLNVSAANAGTGLGAIIGGITITQWGLTSIGYVATGIAAVAILMVAWIVRLK